MQYGSQFPVRCDLSNSGELWMSLWMSIVCASPLFFTTNPSSTRGSGICGASGIRMSRQSQDLGCCCPLGKDWIVFYRVQLSLLLDLLTEKRRKKAMFLKTLSWIHRCFFWLIQMELRHLSYLFVCLFICFSEHCITNHLSKKLDLIFISQYLKFQPDCTIERCTHSAERNKSQQ